MIFNKSKCYNGGLQHNFQPRFSEVPNDGITKRTIESHDIRSILYYKVYVKDVCVWCGKEVVK